MHHASVALEGHIIDSLALPKVWDTIMDMGGNFDVEDDRPDDRTPLSGRAGLSTPR